MGIFPGLHLDHHRRGCLAGGVHDFIVLVASVRSNGLSLPKIAQNILGPIARHRRTIATFFIIVATLAGVAK